MIDIQMFTLAMIAEVHLKFEWSSETKCYFSLRIIYDSADSFTNPSNMTTIKKNVC